MFVDTAKLYVKAGDGGMGCNSYEHDQAGRKLRHNGGYGGNGGDIFFRVDENVHTLLDFQYRQHFEGAPGGNGSSNNKKGAAGQSRIIKVPQGTIVKDTENGAVLADLTIPAQEFLIAKGGAGGSGNSRFRPATEGREGEERRLLLELKLIADVGLLGYPNAGKSTLISRISKAHPKIANYPFTTKEPILGVVRSGTFEFIVADLPGIIEGAHLGKGLGYQFLRHIERTKILIHLIDMSGLNARDPRVDFRKLNKELSLYSKELAKKPQIIVANKMDVGATAKEALKKFKAVYKKKKIIPISAMQGEGLDLLLKAVSKELRKFSDTNDKDA